MTVIVRDSVSIGLRVYLTAILEKYENSGYSFYNDQISYLDKKGTGKKFLGIFPIEFIDVIPNTIAFVRVVKDQDETPEIALQVHGRQHMNTIRQIAEELNQKYSSIKIEIVLLTA